MNAMKILDLNLHFPIRRKNYEVYSIDYDIINHFSCSTCSEKILQSESAIIQIFYFKSGTFDLEDEKNLKELL